MKTKLKRNDQVIVIAGKEKGKKGKIIDFVVKKNTRTKTIKNKVVIEGVNIVKKHTKPSQTNEEGGIFEKEAGIDISNVMIFDKKSKSASRIAKIVDKDGKKKRIAKKSKEVIG